MINISRFYNYKSYIFDFDGVILESNEVKTKAFKKLFDFDENISNKVIDFHKKNQGKSRYEKFDWIYLNILKKKLSINELKLLDKKLSDLILDEILTCQYVDGIIKLLSNLRKNKLVFIASATPHKELEYIVNRLEINEYFDQIYGSPMQKKNIIEDIKINHSLLNKEIIFIGDSESDFFAARYSNIDFLARNSGGYEKFWEKNKITMINNFNLINEI